MRNAVTCYTPNGIIKKSLACTDDGTKYATKRILNN